MLKDAALITISVVLFVQMGLSEAIQDAIEVRFRILSCPKCASFWLVLGWSVIHGNPLIECVAVSFICSYSAMWLALVYDALAVLYNKAYGKVLPESGAEKARSNAVSGLSKTKK